MKQKPDFPLPFLSNHVEINNTTSFSSFVLFTFGLVKLTNWLMNIVLCSQNTFSVKNGISNNSFNLEAICSYDFLARKKTPLPTAKSLQ